MGLVRRLQCLASSSLLMAFLWNYKKKVKKKRLRSKLLIWSVASSKVTGILPSILPLMRACAVLLMVAGQSCWSSVS